MDRQEMIERTAELFRLRKEIEKELEGYVLVLTAGKTSGTMLETDNVKLRVCSRNDLIPTELEKRVSISMWTSITKRIPVAALVKAAIERGKLSQDIIDASSKETRRWLEIR